MNWVSTNIRFPEDQYRKLKIKAAKERKSLAKVVREATTEAIAEEKPRKRIINVAKFMRELEKLAQENSKEVGKDFDFTKALREMRYSQSRHIAFKTFISDCNHNCAGSVIFGNR